MERVGNKKFNFRKGGNKMIKCDFAKVSWSGPKVIMYAELSTLIHALIKREKFTPEEIDEIVADAKKTEEQIAEEVEAIKREAPPEQVAFADMAADLMDLLMKLGDD